MRLHPETTAAFRRGLFDGVLPPGVTAGDPSEAGTRFAVYRNNVLHSLTEALRTRFPTVETLVGPEFFAAMARVFIENNPPKTPLLHDYGAGFPGFLRRFPPLRHLPYLPDVARIERLRGLAYHAADAAPLPPERLALALTGSRGVALHPSVHLLNVSSPAVSIWRAHHGGPQGPFTQRPEQALIARDSDLRVIVVPLEPSSLAFCEALQDGRAFVAALAAARLGTPGFEPAPTLALLLSSGLIVERTAP
jgi:hypothetical protein